MELSANGWAIVVAGASGAGVAVIGARALWCLWKVRREFLTLLREVEDDFNASLRTSSELRLRAVRYSYSLGSDARQVLYRIELLLSDVEKHLETARAAAARGHIGPMIDFLPLLQQMATQDGIAAFRSADVKIFWKEDLQKLLRQAERLLLQDRRRLSDTVELTRPQ